MLSMPDAMVPPTCQGKGALDGALVGPAIALGKIWGYLLHVATITQARESTMGFSLELGLGFELC